MYVLGVLLGIKSMRPGVFISINAKVLIMVC